MNCNGSRRRFQIMAALPSALLLLGTWTLAAADASSPPEPLSVRLSPSQYKQSIGDIFGSSISILGRFEPETRDQGLLAIGARKANITDTGLQRYDEIARGIAAQVVDERHRALLLPCQPKSPEKADDQCAREFFGRLGSLLYRRNFTLDEVRSKALAADDAARSLHDFYAGLSAVLADMLVSPEFLFRQITTEQDRARPGEERIDAYSTAAQLSFFLWNTTPDEQLLKAAASKELQKKIGLERQVDRLISSPRIEASVRAFFSDLLGFSDFETLSKDPMYFPRYTLRVRDDSQEQTLRTIVDHVLVRQADYRDLITTPHTFLTRSLAALYGVPLVDMTDNGQPQRWLPYTYPPGDPRSGILAQSSFQALHSPSGRSSPTLRGKAVREYLLCQTVPPPPANVDFKIVQDTNNPAYKTTRARLTAHRSDPVCAGCHRITDPIGLGLENFDSSGGYRTTENGEVIDASGDFNKVKFGGPAELAQAIHDDPALTSCVAKRVFAFATGRLPPAQDPEWLGITQRFAESHYNFLQLLREIALSELAYRVPSSPKPVQTASASVDQAIK